MPPPGSSGRTSPPVIFTPKMFTKNGVEVFWKGVWNTLSMLLPSMIVLRAPSPLMVTPLRMSRSPVAAKSSPLPVIVSL
jgi:hypothetical protein